MSITVKPCPVCGKNEAFSSVHGWMPHKCTGEIMTITVKGENFRQDFNTTEAVTISRVAPGTPILKSGTVIFIPDSEDSGKAVAVRCGEAAVYFTLEELKRAKALDDKVKALWKLCFEQLQEMEDYRPAGGWKK